VSPGHVKSLVKAKYDCRSQVQSLGRLSVPSSLTSTSLGHVNASENAGSRHHLAQHKHGLVKPLSSTSIPTLHRMSHTLAPLPKASSTAELSRPGELATYVRPMGNADGCMHARVNGGCSLRHLASPWHHSAQPVVGTLPVASPEACLGDRGEKSIGEQSRRRHRSGLLMGSPHV
jgi:hypothetical protein